MNYGYAELSVSRDTFNKLKELQGIIDLVDDNLDFMSEPNKSDVLTLLGGFTDYTDISNFNEVGINCEYETLKIILKNNSDDCFNTNTACNILQWCLRRDNNQSIVSFTACTGYEEDFRAIICFVTADKIEYMDSYQIIKENTEKLAMSVTDLDDNNSLAFC